MPFAILHQLVLPGFLGTILSVEKRSSFHIKMVSLPSHGIPQDQTVIIVLASPVCSAPHWAWC